jgi:hypothetical protein
MKNKITFEKYIENSLNGNIQCEPFYIGTATPNYAKKIKDKTGINVNGYNIVIDSYAILHTIKQHGDKKTEEERGQVAVNKSDLLLIPKIIFYPDLIIKSQYKNKRGMNVIKYIKQFKNKYYVLEEIRTGSKVIALNTMYIKINLLCEKQ